MRGVPKWVGGTHANCATEASGGAPHGATKRVRGVPKWVAMMVRMTAVMMMMTMMTAMMMLTMLTMTTTGAHLLIYPWTDEPRQGPMQKEQC